jgi:hypothetical protein
VSPSCRAHWRLWRLNGVAGIFTFWPRRVFSRMFFPENPMLGFYIVLTLFLVIFSAYWPNWTKAAYMDVLKNI